MSTMRPKRAFSMPFDARLTTRKAPVRFVSTTLVNSSSLMRRRSVSRVMPAFATTTSTGPRAASTSLNAWSTDAASVTSARTVSEPSGPSPERAVTATQWPCATNSAAIAKPMPRLPPVTRTVRLVVMLDSVLCVWPIGPSQHRGSSNCGLRGARTDVGLRRGEPRDPTATTMRPPSPEAERRSRMIKYTIAMSIRVLCIFAMLFAQGWWLAVCAAGAIFLPYFAVVLANVGSPTGRTTVLRPGSIVLSTPPQNDGRADAPAGGPADTAHDADADDEHDARGAA